jgi:hypothetical protein
MRALSLVRNTIALTALSALALGGSLTAASAQDTYYNTGTYTVDVAHSVFDDAFVGADSDLPPGDSLGNPSDSLGNPSDSLGNTSVNLLMDGFLGAFLLAFDSSQGNLSGGTLRQVSGVNFSNPSTGGFTPIGGNLVATNAGATLTNTNTRFGGTNFSGHVLNVGNGFLPLAPQNVSPAAVPELSSLLGFGSFLALGGLAAFRQRKTARQAV